MSPKLTRRIISAIGILFMFISFIILLDYSHAHCSIEDNESGYTCSEEIQSICTQFNARAWELSTDDFSVACPFSTGTVVLGVISLVVSMIFLALYVYFIQLKMKIIIAGAVGDLLLFISMILMFVDVHKGANAEDSGDDYNLGTQSIFIVASLFSLFGVLDMGFALFRAYRESKDDQNNGEYTSAGFTAD